MTDTYRTKILLIDDAFLLEAHNLKRKVNQAVKHPEPVIRLDAPWDTEKLEFFEPPAVPGFGAAGGFSVNLLDKTNSGDYKALGEVTDKFMKALGERKELKGLFTFFAGNYPQFELVIDNEVAMQKGVSIN